MAQIVNSSLQNSDLNWRKRENRPFRYDLNQIPLNYTMKSESECCSVVSNSLQPSGLHSPWNSPGQNIGVGSLSPLQGELYSVSDKEIQEIRPDRQSAWKSMDRDLYHGTGDRDQDHPQEEMQKCKMVVWGGLTNSWEKKRSERQRKKGKIYPSESRVQRIARREKKAFLSDQWKETEENNTMGKTKDPFKKIRDTKGIFHAKMGTIKNRNSIDLTEA